MRTSYIILKICEGKSHLSLWKHWPWLGGGLRLFGRRTNTSRGIGQNSTIGVRAAVGLDADAHALDAAPIVGSRRGAHPPEFPFHFAVRHPRFPSPTIQGQMIALLLLLLAMSWKTVDFVHQPPQIACALAAHAQNFQPSSSITSGRSNRPRKLRP